MLKGSNSERNKAFPNAWNEALTREYLHEDTFLGQINPRLHIKKNYTITIMIQKEQEDLNKYTVMCKH